MKRFKAIIILLLFLPVPVLFAASFDMIPVGDPILDDLRYLSLEAEKSFLSFTPPFSPYEIEQFLNELDTSLLSEPAMDAYNRIKNRLSPEARLSFSAGSFSAQIKLNATLEARTRFNTDIQWEPLYPEIPPLLSFPITFFFADILQLYMEPSIGVNRSCYNEANAFGINIPIEYLDFEATQPLRAFAAAGGSWWNFQLGRDRLFWGTGKTGSLSFSDNSDYFEFARLSFFSRYFKYSLLVNQMPLEIGNLVDPLPPDKLTQTVQRYFYLHRIDANFFNRVSLGVMEGVMVGNAPLEIRYLNPLMIFHSFFSWYNYDTWGEPKDEEYMNGSFLSIEVNWNITKSLAAYGQFAMNQVALPVEIEANPDQPPNGFGYLAGLQYSHSFDNWASVFFLEFIYTDPYLYLNPSPFASLIQMRFSMGEPEDYYYYMGYPRDTIALTLGARFFNQDTLSLLGEFAWLSRGEHDKDGLRYDWEKTSTAVSEKTPSGTVENKFIVTLSANWKLLPYLTLTGSLTGIYAMNNDHTSGSNTAGGQAVVSVKFQY